MNIKSRNKKHLLLMAGVFIALNALFLLGRNYFVQNSIGINVVLTGNMLLFLLGIFTYNRSSKAIENPNPHVFVRSFYAGFLIRLAVVGVAAFIYIYMNSSKVNSATLFICMGIYAVYAAIEVSSLRKILREKSNA